MEPLDQTIALAALTRRVVGAALSLEHDDEAVTGLIAELEAVASVLEGRVPPDPAPRLGPDPRPEARPYIDHSRDIGAYNPCFPEYSIEVGGARAVGTVAFPLAYEGPPGIVHGGFLALFFDCVIQHHNCDVGVAGKTTGLQVSYRRPVPLLDRLDYVIEREADERRITSRAELSLAGATLCAATMEAVAGDRANLPAVSPRRPRP